MPKEKPLSANPAAAQRKADKQKALKKSKAAIAAQRTERLAHRNPQRLEAQIADLHALRDGAPGGKLGARDQRQLEELERDVGRVRKARETVGGRGASGATVERGVERAGRGGGDGSRGAGGEGRGRGRGGYGGLGKRGRDGGRAAEEEGRESSEETDEEVRRIPWPKDTPPPVPRSDMRHRRQQQQQRTEATSANREPLGFQRLPERKNVSKDDDGGEEDEEKEGPPDTSLPARPSSATAAVRTTYESKPQVRNLQKEATARFMPSAVKKKIDAAKGTVGGRLVEEEEMERLEREGYRGPVEEGGKLMEEEEAFRRALGGAEDEVGRGRGVEVEDVEDEDL